MLTAAQKQHWDDNGFLVLPGFFTNAETESINSEVAAAWEKRPAKLVVDDLVTGQRTYIQKVTKDDAKAHRFKLNDLYLQDGAVRRLALDRRVVAILRDLLGDAPVLCNTLNLEQGSEQDDHMDNLYMTPRTPGRLVATWFALEDSHVDAGPLRYFPGSHRFPLFRFSDGKYTAISSEMDGWSAHIRQNINKESIAPEEFIAKRGDLFIWHANLVHGGGAIKSKSRTRKSLVNHYWGLEDCKAQGLNTAPLGAGYWFDRPPQAVPATGLKKMLGPIVRRLRQRVSAAA